MQSRAAEVSARDMQNSSDVRSDILHIVYASSEVFIPTIQDKLLISDNALFNYLRLNLHQTKG